MNLLFLDLYQAAFEKIKQLPKSKSYLYVIELDQFRVKLGISTDIESRIQCHHDLLFCYSGKEIKRVAIFDLLGENHFVIETKYTNLLSQSYQTIAREWFLASFDSIMYSILNHDFDIVNQACYIIKQYIIEKFDKNEKIRYKDVKNCLLDCHKIPARDNFISIAEKLIDEKVIYKLETIVNTKVNRDRYMDKVIVSYHKI